ncbi:hypothetical protein [Verrucomicrobium sp. 3C]|uniref:hypothetical protein n=1 Tax=Verrucomicrobium sp. 3C TaxID=1134055 RepID=UPI0012DEE6D8|nr:hypothetical protein [Verrucomicrobium sp. 3C]
MTTCGCINPAPGSHRLRERPDGRAETLTDYRAASTHLMPRRSVIADRQAGTGSRQHPNQMPGVRNRMPASLYPRLLSIRSFRIPEYRSAH